MREPTLMSTEIRPNLPRKPIRSFLKRTTINLAAGTAFALLVGAVGIRTLQLSAEKGMARKKQATTMIEAARFVFG